jgi:hypothetical protein
MPSDDPVFSIRSLGAAEYVVDVLWPNGMIEQLTGVYSSPDHAARWIDDRSELWVRDRLGKSIH